MASSCFSTASAITQPFEMSLFRSLKSLRALSDCTPVAYTVRAIKVFPVRASANNNQPTFRNVLLLSQGSDVQLLLFFSFR